MKHLIDKDNLVAEIERLDEFYHLSKGSGGQAFVESLLSFLNTLEVKEIQEEPTSTAYVVTRCEEHSDYVEEVFFDENKAQEYCDQFKGNENEYARHITKVKVTL